MTDMSELRMILIGPNILVIICATDRIFKGRNGSLLLKIDSFIHFRLFIFTRQYCCSSSSDHERHYKLRFSRIIFFCKSLVIFNLPIQMMHDFNWVTNFHVIHHHHLLVICFVITS